MNKFERLKADLAAVGTGKMKAFGQSMLPIVKSGSLLTFEVKNEYKVGDIVFCKVKGKYIDAYKIAKISSDAHYLIANNHGHENGWTKIIYGKMVKSEYKGEVRCF